MILSDFPYTCLNGSDRYEDLTPDIYCGRWPIRNINDLQTIIDKTIWYEQQPSMNPEFYRNASHFSFFEDGSRDNTGLYAHDGMEDSRFIKTSEDVRSYLLKEYRSSFDDINRLYGHYTNGEFKYWPSEWNSYYAKEAGKFPLDLMHNLLGFSWNYNSSDLIKAVNNGNLYILYIGHGDSYAWGNERDILFDCSDVLKLHNNNQLPLLFSMCCFSGNHSKDECIVRDFMTKRNGGVIASFGATNYGFYGLQEKLISLYFNAVWNKPGFSLKGYDGIGISYYLTATSSRYRESITQLGPIHKFAMK